jgi:hypothetical protein
MIISPSSYPVEWRRPSEIITQFAYNCSVRGCGKVLIEEYLGLVPMIPAHPGNGWILVGESWVCPNHKVEVFIDGEKSEYK